MFTVHTVRCHALPFKKMEAVEIAPAVKSFQSSIATQVVFYSLVIQV